MSWLIACLLGLRTMASSCFSGFDVLCVRARLAETTALVDGPESVERQSSPAECNCKSATPTLHILFDGSKLQFSRGLLNGNSGRLISPFLQTQATSNNALRPLLLLQANQMSVPLSTCCARPSFLERPEVSWTSRPVHGDCFLLLVFQGSVWHMTRAFQQATKRLPEVLVSSKICIRTTQWSL